MTGVREALFPFLVDNDLYSSVHKPAYPVSSYEQEYEEPVSSRSQIASAASIADYENPDQTLSQVQHLEPISNVNYDQMVCNSVLKKFHKIT